MKKAFSFLVLFTLFASVCLDAFAVDTAAIDRVREGVDRSPVVRARFEQTKTIRSLKRPLVVSGRLVFSQRHGVLWAIDAPYRITYVLGEDRVAEIDDAGTRRERASSELPGFSQVSRVFRALLSAKTQVLGEYFDVRVKTSAEGEGTAPWELVLTPRQDHLARFLSGMRVSGARFVENLSIDEAGGNRSEIRFFDTRGDGALSGDERALFGDLSPEKP
ncbi:MAG: outer membrane lipoprotein carrier protein LolA [Candidatus Accumulibacter sp.]|jgi:outer membrane lipoprotein-sorting protein|nr:outer membrane lipoprotein carrier protein LolA [Accumulibacter sp.]